MRGSAMLNLGRPAGTLPVRKFDDRTTDRGSRGMSFFVLQENLCNG